ncbi:alkene reductase [Pseudomonas capeferrum]|uniref:alkene reductase n=1 Tax=Pseudomonas capeferrum TaxID=1495066 RepID=UPI0030D8F382
MKKLFTSYDLAGLQLANRVVMAPMTRTRTEEHVPTALTAHYYAQRASAGLIITEGLPVSDEGRGYLYTPGIYTDKQASAWRDVTDAVHDKGGKIFAQLWHVGRMSHVSLQASNAAPVSASAEPAVGTTVYAWVEPGLSGPVAPSVPRALNVDEIHRITQDFVSAALRAMEAGFDGVELMAANAFLFDQFLSSQINTRTDEYGGSIKNRQRFLLETVDAIADVIGGFRVGVRISPFGRLYDLRPYAEEEATWNSVAAELNERDLAFVHLNYQPTLEAVPFPDGFFQQFRSLYKGTLIGAGGFTAELAETVLKDNSHDLIAFGTPYIANPDLVERMQNDWPLTPSDRSTFYGVIGTKGYTDYEPYKGCGSLAASNQL